MEDESFQRKFVRRHAGDFSYSAWNYLTVDQVTKRESGLRTYRRADEVLHL